MIGWGGLPNFTEYNAQGQVVYDAQLPHGENSYRVYRHRRGAVSPRGPPSIAAVKAGSTSGRLRELERSHDGRLLAAADGSERERS